MDWPAPQLHPWAHTTHSPGVLGPECGQFERSAIIYLVKCFVVALYILPPQLWVNLLLAKRFLMDCGPELINKASPSFKVALGSFHVPDYFHHVEPVLSYNRRLSNSHSESFFDNGICCVTTCKCDSVHLSLRRALGRRCFMESTWESWRSWCLRVSSSVFAPGLCRGHQRPLPVGPPGVFA